jgi:hypothetical protein
MLAVIWSPWKTRPAARRGTLELFGWGGLLALMLLYNLLNEFQPFLYRGGILLTALASALLIVGASSPATSISRMLEHPLLRWIGSRSYSIYLWHWPVFMLTRPGFDLDLPTLPLRVGQVAVTFALAELSYRWIESPVRQHGFRASIRSLQSTVRGWSLPQRYGVVTGVVSMSLLLIWQGMIRPVNANAALEDEPSTLRTPSSNVLQPVPTKPAINTQQASSRSTEIPIPHTATPGIHLPRVTFIGDSIMQGATPMMEDVFGEDVYIDAARKRKMEDVPALVETLSDVGNLSRTVVIHLGSNRPFETPVFDEVMKALLAHGVERVIFINVHRPVGWEFYINKKFAEGVARWPAAELIDWDALAHSEKGWFIRDGTYLSYDGSEAYVNAIKEKLSTPP